VERHDGALIAQSIRNPEVFEVVFDRYYQAVYRFAVGRAGVSEAGDVAGETFLRAFARRHRFDVEQTNALPWLFGIAVNVTRERFRKVNRGRRALDRVAAAPEIISPFEGEAVERTDALSRTDELASALADLTDDEYQVLMLSALGDLSYQEIADSLDIPIGTVRSRLARARRKMRELMEPDRSIPAADEPATRTRFF
jgi:RNA polymerase sigma factor (sigma-70 family)